MMSIFRNSPKLGIDLCRSGSVPDYLVMLRGFVGERRRKEQLAEPIEKLFSASSE